jgi:3-methyladenine DNA glycosylase Tag
MPPQTPPEQIEAKTLDDYLEIMSKAVFQSGMSWKVVEAKWPTTRQAFFNFDTEKIADMVATWKKSTAPSGTTCALTGASMPPSMP